MWVIYGFVGLLALIIVLILLKRFFWWLFNIKPKENPEKQKQYVYRKLKGKQFHVKPNKDGSMYHTNSYGINVSATSPEGVMQGIKRKLGVN